MTWIGLFIVHHIRLVLNDGQTEHSKSECTPNRAIS
jgi:hypothetical protein